ncbi:phage putative ATP-dependent DNA helicase [Salmonella phage SPFM12]|nr:phage putative ATP-dependent DNA helicase [Salmonella phage SPFM12]
MSFRIEWGEIDPTVWLFHAYNVPKHLEDQQLNEQMAGRPRKILHNGKAGTAVDKPGLVHMYISTPDNAGDSYDDFIQADFSISTPEYVKDKLSRDPVFHPLMVAK